MTRDVVTRNSDGVTIDLPKEEAEQANTNAGARKVVTMDGYIQRLAYTAQGMVEYIGLANPDTATSEAKWQIKKLTYSGTSVTQIDFADGNLNFDNIWDNRSGLSYS